MEKIPQTIAQQLSEPYALTADQVAFYQKNRYIKLKEVLDAETIAFFNDAITQQVNKMNTQQKSLDERDTYGKAFLQLFLQDLL